MINSTPASAIVAFLRSCPKPTDEILAANAYLIVAQDFSPRPGDCYVDLVREYLSVERHIRAKHAVILVAAALDHHFAVARPMTSADFLAIAKEVPTDFVQMSVLTADDRLAAFEAAKEEWAELREGILSPVAIQAWGM